MVWTYIFSTTSNGKQHQHKVQIDEGKIEDNGIMIMDLKEDPNFDPNKVKIIIDSGILLVNEIPLFDFNTVEPTEKGLRNMTSHRDLEQEKKDEEFARQLQEQEERSERIREGSNFHNPNSDEEIARRLMQEDLQENENPMDIDSHSRNPHGLFPHRDPIRPHFDIFSNSDSTNLDPLPPPIREILSRQRNSFGNSGISLPEFLFRRFSERENGDNMDPDAMNYQQLLNLGERIGRVERGLDDNGINQLPVSKFDKNTAKGDLTCSICRCEYEDGEEIRRLPCLHYFHKDCIDQWIKSNPTCPICKTKIKFD
ncbi:hypothetical protein M0811_09348 [Anaeramoeba ignava]|uniref:RING-type domain-containing protein n=1 Tax=Anaeramoeba ignava TaxID=1746090 RepID=A0A9Q0LHC7_ANAIG|nr:hypothetical protein M0811_09348 [Anaeramoeba ignava]